MRVIGDFGYQVIYKIAMNKPLDTFVPDSYQQRVLDATEGFHLVLAAPGCGKTHLLAHRIALARLRGVSYADMLCLTFTNRAAKGMADRMQRVTGGELPDDLYIGNIHRYCSKFLFEQGVLSAGTSVIDDEDAISILARYMEEDEEAVTANPRRKSDYAEMIHLSHLMHQIEQEVPKELRLHPECVSTDDITALKHLCRMLNTPFTPQSMSDIYHHAHHYMDSIREAQMDPGLRAVIQRMLGKMWGALCYERYKTENELVDFEDLLIQTYEALTASDAPHYKRYSWIQVDEVQDLNLLQLTIVDLLTDDTPQTSVLFLGDEQQAIFSFMGAKAETLARLKNRCGDHIYHLGTNHRSPKYLLDVFNGFATDVLHIDGALLPKADNSTPPPDDALRLLACDSFDDEVVAVADLATQLSSTNTEETTAIVVNANADAEILSKALLLRNTPHFKVSGTDLFATPSMKLLLAHFNVLANKLSFMSWARIFKGVKALQTNTAARNFTRQLFNRALLPDDLLTPFDSTLTQCFCRACETETLVVFDTETTGLDVFEDDIAQIAAVKMSNGKVVDGSRLNLFLQTKREIPAKLGDLDNPLFEERRHHTLLPPSEALQQFMDYAAGATLIGHNADFDYHILAHNLRRYLPHVVLEKQHDRYFDTLLLARLLVPGRHSYKLKDLLAALNLAGENSHLADADVDATCSLVKFCYECAMTKSAEQQTFLALDKVQRIAQTFAQNYAPLYQEARQSYRERLAQPGITALEHALHHAHRELCLSVGMAPVEKLGYVCRYFSQEICSPDIGNSLYEQLSAYLMTLNTLKEADLCGTTSMTERLFISTVHKAKGLEFDNVIVFDAVDGRYPNHYHRHEKQAVEEDARKLYVALTRAKKRVIVTQSTIRKNYRNETFPVSLTPFMEPLLRFFTVTT